MSDTLKTCEYCGKEFVAKRSTARFDSAACKLNFNRAKNVTENPPPVADTPPAPSESLPVLPPEIKQAFSSETREQWLKRRIQETGSKGSAIIKTGYPPGSTGTIEVPQKWEIGDFDVAVDYRTKEAQAKKDARLTA